MRQDSVGANDELSDEGDQVMVRQFRAPKLELPASYPSRVWGFRRMFRSDRAGRAVKLRRSHRALSSQSPV